MWILSETHSPRADFGTEGRIRKLLAGPWRYDSNVCYGVGEGDGSVGLICGDCGIVRLQD